ncbi:glycosyltransferase [Methylobacterium sp. A54F]
MRPVTRHRVVKATVGYPIQALRTLAQIVRHKPDVLWIQAPPNVLVHIAWLGRLLRWHRMKIVADLHNASLSRFWLAVPMTRRLLNTFDIVIVHNEMMRTFAVEKGLSADRVRVLEDRTPDIAPTTAAGSAERPYVVMPCSFSRDEPVLEVIAAARLVPEIDFLATGDSRSAAKRSLPTDLPPNFRLTGFLEADAYERLIAGSLGMLCLTTEDGIQLSAASEAVGFGKPMIISDTSLLRSLFGAGLFVDNSPEAIGDACRAVLKDYRCYASATQTLQLDARRSDRWQAQASSVAAILKPATQA